MDDLSSIAAGMAVVGADDAPVGKVASVAGDRIRLEPAGVGGHAGHHHYIPGGLVAEVGVVAAPLAHPVQPLQDPASDPAGRLRVVVGARRGAARRLEQRERGVLVLGDRRRVGRVAAEPRDRLGAVQRRARPARASRRRPR